MPLHTFNYIHTYIYVYERQLTWLDALNEVGIVHQLAVQSDGKSGQRLAVDVCLAAPLCTHLYQHDSLSTEVTSNFPLLLCRAVHHDAKQRLRS